MRFRTTKPGLAPSTSSVPSAGLLEALHAVLAQVAEPVQVLRTVLELAVSQTGADRGVFVEVGEGGELEYKVLHRFQREQLSGDKGQFSRTIFAHVLDKGEGLILEDAIHHPSFEKSYSVNLLRLTSILCMPIRLDDQIVALVHLENSTPGHFRESHREILRGLLGVAGPLLAALRAGGEVLTERDRLRSAESALREEAEENRGVLAREWSFARFVGRSPAVRELEVMVRKASATDFPVLLVGDTGTGKSIIARILHSSGHRSSQAFATVFCPSLEKGMVEAELFGHRKGAFTGALADRAGKVQTADKGTLFLDEIGELPLDIQPKLLRLLQEKTYERVGDSQERRADVRVIGATNRDLEAEVRAGRFRRDLYERLNFVPINLPPLRERREDIGLLLRHCLDSHASGRWIQVSQEGSDYLSRLDFTWPGNVRHLEQLAARLILDAPRAPVGSAELVRLLGPSVQDGTGSAAEPVSVMSAKTGGRALSTSVEAGLPALLEESERAWLAEALRRYPKLTRSELAAKLKISESALYKKLKDYHLGSS